MTEVNISNMLKRTIRNEKLLRICGWSHIQDFLINMNGACVCAVNV